MGGGVSPQLRRRAGDPPGLGSIPRTQSSGSARGLLCSPAAGLGTPEVPAHVLAGGDRPQQDGNGAAAL